MTAVEWLVEQLNKEGFAPVLTNEEIKQAKEMEKEQIIDAWNIRAKIDGILTHTDNRTAEQYYKQTFKTKQND
jgi:hypothetical protein